MKLKPDDAAAERGQLRSSGFSRLADGAKMKMRGGRVSDLIARREVRDKVPQHKRD